MAWHLDVLTDIKLHPRFDMEILSKKVRLICRCLRYLLQFYFASDWLQNSVQSMYNVTVILTKVNYLSVEQHGKKFAIHGSSKMVVMIMALIKLC